jgi:hypothetical protein
MASSFGSGIGGIMGAVGGLIDILNAPSKPDVPVINRLELGSEAGKAIKSNLTNLSKSEELVGKANLFSEQQITDMLNRSIPGYSAMSGKAASNISSELSGEIPQDVQDAIQNNAAAKALGGGFSGGGMHGNLVARDLGLTSLDLTQKGLNSFESWTKTAASLYEPSMMSVSSMFVTPEQMYKADNEQNLIQANQQWMQNQISAMSDPTLTAISGFLGGAGKGMVGGSSGDGGDGGSM